jgi:hypothetical protein
MSIMSMIYPKNMEHLVCIYLISTIYDILSQHHWKWVSVRIWTQKIHTKENHKKIIERIYSYRPGDDGVALYCIQFRNEQTDTPLGVFAKLLLCLHTPWF